MQIFNASLSRRFLPLLLGLSLAACSSTRLVDIDSHPPGATILVNGKKIGITRCVAEIDFGKQEITVIELVKARHRSFSKTITIEDVDAQGLKLIFTLDPE